MTARGRALRAVVGVFVLGLLVQPSLAGEGQVPRRGHGLLVTVSAYPASTGLPPLQAEADAARMEVAWRALGVAPERLVSLRDESATVDGLRSGLTAMASVVQPGDQAFVHFSGHGLRVPDSDGDEPDGQDEAIALWPDAPDGPAPAVLVDDELGLLLRTVRERLGVDGRLLVSLDSCFSGSATRGVAVTRGVGGVGATPAKTESGAGVSELLADGGGLAPMVVLSAARHDQPALEVPDPDQPQGRAGAFTMALARVLAEGGGTTARQIHEQVRNELHRMGLSQEPQAEGAVDLPFFPLRRGWRGGLAVQRVSERQVMLSGGTLHGLSEGSRVALFSAEGKDDAPVATGTITSVDIAGAQVSLDAPVLPQGVLVARLTSVKADRHAVSVGLAADLRDGAAIRELLRDLAWARVDDEDPDLRVVDDHGGAAIIDPRDGRVLATVPGGAEAPAAVLRHLRARFLRSVPLADPEVRVRLEILPATQVADPLTPCMVSGAARRAASYTPGTLWIPRLVHEGTRPAWVTMLSLAPDGRVAVLLPAEHASDLRLEAGTSLVLRRNCFQVDPTPGEEVLLLLASTVRLDVRGLLEGAPGGLERDDEGAGPLSSFLGLLHGPGEERDARLLVDPREQASVDRVVITVLAPRDRP